MGLYRGSEFQILGLGIQALEFLGRSPSPEPTTLCTHHSKIELLKRVLI